ncbi:MAG TPA: bacteriohopanetetrol glucosamine biosynthesis glycosyltransferase HpnI [Bryobacteraceae bacterium]|nr:bacteriohopanetetrol glucosamine biosynthesis glycosyltransferase HpnI [Bryobacteraceae bacterium]
MLVAALLILVAGSLAFCVLTVAAVAQFCRTDTKAGGKAAGPNPPPISVLKPLAGVDDGLEENLRTFFGQEYGEFEILFAVRNASDPAVAVVERLRAAYPLVPSRLIVTGEPPYANAKVYSLDRMLASARHDLLVMADSDVRVDPHLLAAMAAEFSTPKVGVVTCPYRAAPGRSFWSTLEAIGLNTDFIGGVLVARMLEGMKFALGPTIAARRGLLAEIGGFDVLKNYLAEDFILGNLAARRGYQVVLSSYVIEHRIGSQPLAANWKHRLRWNRSTRRSRPWGYVGQVFMYPLPLVLLVWAVRADAWPLVLVAAAMRAVSAFATGGLVLHDPLLRRGWWLVPLQDIMSFAVWLASFFGNTIIWRGRRYHLSRDGTFTACAPRAVRR